jgi:hypothetical protein
MTGRFVLPTQIYLATFRGFTFHVFTFNMQPSRQTQYISRSPWDPPNQRAYRLLLSHFVKQTANTPYCSTDIEFQELIYIELSTKSIKFVILSIICFVMVTALICKQLHLWNTPPAGKISKFSARNLFPLKFRNKRLNICMDHLTRAMWTSLQFHLFRNGYMKSTNYNALYDFVACLLGNATVISRFRIW